MNKVQLLRRKHIYIKLGTLLLLVLTTLLAVFCVYKQTSSLYLIGSILLASISFIFFVLSLFTKTIRYNVGNRTFYLCIGIFSHYLTSRRHILDRTHTFWFGKYSLYYELNTMEVEARIAAFRKTVFLINNEEIQKA